MNSSFRWFIAFCLTAIHWSADPCQKNDPDDCWISYLESPPLEAIQLAQNLSARADSITAALPESLKVTGDVDVSVSGGGNYDAYWMGVSMVLSRVRALQMHRFTGASAGGMMPFEQVLKGYNATLLTHLSYGVLTKLYPEHFSSLTAALEQDHHWRLMAAWQTKKYADSLASLDDKVYLALSCLDPLPKLVIVSKFTAQKDQATHAFMGTGTAFEMYDGMACSDGGSTSGPKMTPLFQDNVRPQIIVNLMETGYPSEMVYKVVTEQWVKVVQLGQDEAAEFLKTGKVSRSRDAITFCPKGSKVDKNICELTTAVVV
jgi:hypothetical protein